VARAGFHRDTLHGKEMRLASIGAEVSRVRECAGVPHRVAEAALALVRRHIYDLEGLSAGAVAWRPCGSRRGIWASPGR